VDPGGRRQLPPQQSDADPREGERVGGVASVLRTGLGQVVGEALLGTADRRVEPADAVERHHPAFDPGVPGTPSDGGAVAGAVGGVVMTHLSRGRWGLSAGRGRTTTMAAPFPPVEQIF
jgi:hypothetical protein